MFRPHDESFVRHYILKHLLLLSAYRATFPSSIRWLTLVLVSREIVMCYTRHTVHHHKELALRLWLTVDIAIVLFQVQSDLGTSVNVLDLILGQLIFIYFTVLCYKRLKLTIS